MNECNVFTLPEVWKITSVSEYLTVHWSSVFVIAHYYSDFSNSVVGEGSCSWWYLGIVSLYWHQGDCK